MSEDFFDVPLDQSKVKGEIVSKYFDAWAHIIKPHANNIAYIDLFAGKGCYEDGTPSTPILVLRKAIQDPEIAHKFVCEFNDQHSDFIKSLTLTVQELEGIEKLANLPKVSNITVSKEIVNRYAGVKQLTPALFFLDPWGYKGLSLDLIKVAIKDWASECLLFFNYNQINRDITNPLVRNIIDELFGKVRAANLRERIKGMTPYEREQTIIQEFCHALKEMKGKYTLPFCFLNRKKDRTSHYLIHVTKNKRGYGVIKEIMAGYSREDEDGVPAYIFDPKPTMQLMLNFNRSLKTLCEQLVADFRGQTIKVKIIYDRHQEKTRFIRKNYKDALCLLEKESKIKVDVSFAKRRFVKGKVTLGDDRVVTFR